jgi:hypothetical protein
MFDDNWMSGFTGAIVGGICTLIGGWFASWYTFNKQAKLDAHRRKEQEQMECQRVRRRFEINLRVARSMGRAADLIGAYCHLKLLRDIMKEHAWLCDPKPNQLLFETYLLRLPEDVPAYQETYVLSIAEAARNAIVPEIPR